MLFLPHLPACKIGIVNMAMSYFEYSLANQHLLLSKINCFYVMQNAIKTIIIEYFMLVGTSRGHLPFLRETGLFQSHIRFAQFLSVSNISKDRDPPHLWVLFPMRDDLHSELFFLLPTTPWCSPCPWPLALPPCTTFFSIASHH